MTNQEYVDNCGYVCPNCGSSNIIGGDFTAGDNECWRNVECQDCEAIWVDCYQLYGFDNLEIGEKK